MEPFHYKPDGDPATHVITAEISSDEIDVLIFVVRSDGVEIGEVDVDIAPGSIGYISGVGEGERINNGYLRPASFVIASCLLDRDPDFKTLYDINNEPLTLSD